MAKRQYLKGNALNDKFLSGFNNYKGLNVILRNNDVILLELDGHKYYVYLKCISHKGLSMIHISEPTRLRRI